jgi:creatinine amidohydrolase
MVLSAAGIAGTALGAQRPEKAADPASTAPPAAGKPRSHKYEELRPEEFYDELKRAPIAYWGCGAMEEHGLHNPLGADPMVAYEVCRRAVEISGGILFPMVPFAPAGVPGYSRTQLRKATDALYPPSLWTSREVCKQLYVELLESLADLGFKACIAFGGHWPADLLLQEIERELQGAVAAMRFWGGGTVSIMRDFLDQQAKKDASILGHGTMWETSLVMALRTDWVDLPRAQRIPESPLPSQLKNIPSKTLQAIARSNAEFGSRLLDDAARRLASRAKAMLRR